MTSRDRFMAGAGGLAAGSFGGLFGVGGGILLVPILTSVLRRSQHQAHGTSLAAIGATALSGLVVYGLHGSVDWRTALLAGPGSALLARVGARTASRMSTRNLRLGFSALLIAVAIRLLLKAAPAAEAPLAQAGPVLRIACEVAIGAVAGFLAGLMGVGGGIIAVPAFTLLLGMSQQTAQGTSLALILFSAPAGALEHARRGNVIGRLALWLAIGSIFGAYLTSSMVQAAPGPWLTRGFAIFLLVNAIPMGIRTLRQPRESPNSPAAGAGSGEARPR